MIRRLVLPLLPLLLLGCATTATPGGLVEVRVENASSVPLDAVMIGFPEETENYGAVAPHTSSEYRDVGSAYRYAAVEVRIDDETLRLTPIDYVGEEELAPGRYTYVLTVDPDLGQLGLDYRRDD